MHTSRTKAIALDPKRIDPDYYAPVHLADEERIRSIGAVELGSGGRLFAGPFGSELPTSVFVSVGVPLFRVGNIGEMQINEQDLAHISEALHSELCSSEVLPGDLLIVKASVGEKICVVPGYIERANITQHIIGMRPNGSLDMGYAAACLFSTYGRRQLQRRALGAIIQYLGVQEARTVLIPQLDAKAQEYIGSLVKQAETLRRTSDQMNAIVKSALDDAFPSPSYSSRSWNRVSATDLSDRLDPRPYRSHRIRLRNRLTEIHADRISDVAKISGGNPVPSSMFVEVGVPLIKNGDIEVDGFKCPTTNSVPHEYHDENRNYWAEADMVVISLDGDIRAQFFLSEDIPAHVNQRVAMLRPHGIPAPLLVAWLNHPALQQQMLSWSVQTTVEHISNAIVAGTFVPRLPEQAEQRISNLVISSRRARLLANVLSKAASFFVEGLVEHGIKESELIGVGNNPDAARALFARLRDDGLDGTGAQLFHDLDALFELIEQVQGTVADS
jgi:type I restriction enzyme S subunit